MDYMSSLGTDVAYRLGYDDVNESLCTASIVQATLRKLGVSRYVVNAGEANCGWTAVMKLGDVKMRINGQSKSEPGTGASAAPAVNLHPVAATASKEVVRHAGAASGTRSGRVLSIVVAENMSPAVSSPRQARDTFDVETAAAFWGQQVCKRRDQGG